MNYHKRPSKTVSLFVRLKFYSLHTDNVAMRGERLELLVNKTEDLQASSVNFRTQSRSLQQSLYWKNVKLYIMLGGIVFVSMIFLS